MLSEFCTVRLLVDSDASQYDDDGEGYNARKGDIGTVLSANKGTDGKQDWYIVSFSDPDVDSERSSTLMHFCEHELEFVRSYEMS